MAVTKWKGQLAEVEVIRDSVERGYRVSLPMSEDCPYDLVVERRGRCDRLERVQCKYVESNGEYVVVRCRTTNRTCEIRYTDHDIDWIATFDATTKQCYYVPSSLLGPHGRTVVHLRLVPTMNAQLIGVRWATDYLVW